MEVLRQDAHPVLRPFVRSFGQRRAQLGEDVLTSPLPARPDQFIEFYLGERYRVTNAWETAALAPEMAVVGPQSRPGVRLHMSGEIDVFTIRFQPTGFHRLFGAPMPSLVDQGVAARDVLGSEAGALEDAIRSAEGFAGRIVAAEAWLAGRLAAARDATALEPATRLMIAARGRVRIDRLAVLSGLGPRQFNRRFVMEVGVTPKFYARTLRLEAALDDRRRWPGRNWTEIVHAVGYADQAHFIRECRALAGEPPTRFMAEQTDVTETFNPDRA